MTTAIIVGVMVIVLLILRKVLRRRPKAVARQEVRQERRRSRRISKMNRRIKTRGIILGAVRMCSCGCGETAGKCKEMTARAEHWTGMLGPRKKK